MRILDCLCRSRQPVILPVAAELAQGAPAGSSSGSGSADSAVDNRPASALRSAGSSSSGGGSVSIAGLAGGLSSAVDHTIEYFNVRVRTGNGVEFSLSIHSKLKVNDLHKQITKRLGEADCPLYAIRLIYKSKVLSHKPDEPVETFGIAEGDLLLLVVVRARSRAHYRPLAHAHIAPAVFGCGARHSEFAWLFRGHALPGLCILAAAFAPC